MDIVSNIALMLGVAWASGIKLYAAVLTLGILGITGNAVLPDELEVLEHPLVIVVAGLMFVIEFFADKIPGLDSAWDALQTFIRIPAGAALAAGAVGSIDPVIVTLAFLTGGAMSAGSHGAKMSSRLVINTSPEPFTNWGASIAEDGIVVGGIYMALNYPILFLAFLCVFVGLVIWLLPKIFHAMTRALTRVASFFRRGGLESNPN